MASALANILFVDDDQNLRQALSRGLRNEAFRQIWADSAESALQALSRDPIDVLVADDRMPGLSGAELVAAIANQDPDIVTILFSGQPSIGSIALALNSGRIFRLLLKPCHTDIIVSTVHEAILARRKRLRTKRVEIIARKLADKLVPMDQPSTSQDDAWLDALDLHLRATT